MTRIVEKVDAKLADWQKSDYTGTYDHAARLCDGGLFRLVCRP